MNKKELRKYYTGKKLELTEKEMIRMDDLLLIQFQQRPLGYINTLASYWPLKEQREVNTHLMADYLSFLIPGLQLAFPVIEPRSATFKTILVDDDTRYLKNAYGIAEPVTGIELPAADIDVIFVPLLAFDKNGFRVGYGKGFYDRFLAECHEGILKVGFSYFEAEERIDDINEFDVPLNICITPKKIYEF